MKYKLFSLVILITNYICFAFKISPFTPNLYNQYNTNVYKEKIIHSNMIYKLSSKLNENVDNSQTIERLRQATLFKSIPANVVKELILTLNLSENQRKQCTKQNLQGVWELVFSTLVPGCYMPVYEEADFFGYTLTSSIAKVIPLGQVYGSSKVIQDIPIRIEFSSSGIRLPFGWDIKFNKVNTRIYDFLYIDSDICIAKSSSGGYSLLRKL